MTKRKKTRKFCKRVKTQIELGMLSVARQHINMSPAHKDYPSTCTSLIVLEVWHAYHRGKRLYKILFDIHGNEERMDFDD